MSLQWNRRAAVIIFLSYFTSFFALADHTDGLPDQSVANRVFNVAQFGAHPDDGISDDAAVARALTEAQRTGGVLLFPPGQWQLDNTLMLSCAPEGPGGDCANPTSKPIQIHGANIGATTIVSAASHAIGIESGYQPVSVLLQDFQLDGLGLNANTEQHGMYFCDNNATVALTIQRTGVKGFFGDGICATVAYNARIVQNRLRSVRTGIRCNECRISVIESNRVSTFLERGIFLDTHPTIATSGGAINVRVVANEITAAAGIDGFCPDEIIGIHIGRGRHNSVENNYFEGFPKPCDAALVVGMMVRANPEVEETGRNSNFHTSIKNNYVSGAAPPEVLIFIAENANYTMLEANNSDIRMIDNGNFTTYVMHRLTSAASPSSIAGEPENQRGWMLGRGSFPVPGNPGTTVINPIFELQEYTPF